MAVPGVRTFGREWLWGAPVVSPVARRRGSSELLQSKRPDSRQTSHTDNWLIIRVFLWGRSTHSVTNYILCNEFSSDTQRWPCSRWAAPKGLPWRTEETWRGKYDRPACVCDRQADSFSAMYPWRPAAPFICIPKSTSGEPPASSLRNWGAVFSPHVLLGRHLDCLRGC